MEVKLHDSVAEFRVIAEPLYRRDPIGRTIELTLLASGEFPSDSLLLTVWDGGTAVGAALQTPPYPLACNGIPHDAINAVATTLVAVRPDLASARGDRGSAVAFADAWQAITGRQPLLSAEERLYRLGMLKPPVSVVGSARAAGDDDRGLLIDWVNRFFEDAFGQANDRAEQFVDGADRAGHRFVVWEVDGTPVSMAMLRVPASGVSRIGPVFTSRDARGRGYGSAVTAAAVQLAHRSGTPDVVLFADLANPTSNGIYQQIGFEPVSDSVRIDFATSD
ncbi:acetyltransferase [Mycobacterium sp. ACS1612]|uniref:GNAT family N-acetyltransferase n=1 Tax=Mycobacterium sp. ACS1612 TaxID=1834117 RepID=UPI0007FBFE0C|nr:GNAT family N-acetyltransferase [Mycobacterium sp. ACS1612]OBF35862.1 acetyltransferase [Mycobacterium sp. ACS1612]